MPAATTGSFADRMDFTTMRQGLAKEGYTLSDQEETILESITRDDLQKHDGGRLLSNNLGADGVNIVYVLFAALKNLIASLSGGGMNNLGSTLTNTFSNAGEQGKLEQLNLATIDINRDLKAQGGKLADIADLVTGQSAGKTFTADNMSSSIFNQVGNTLNIPLSTPTSLDPKPTPVTYAAADNDPAHGLPASAKQPLTPSLPNA